MTEETKIKRKWKFRPIRHTLYLLILCTAIVLVKFFLIQTAKPTITINYVEKVNQLTKPKNYDPANNAAPLYEKAFSALIEKPESLIEILNTYDHYDHIWPGDMEPEELKQLKDWIKSNRQALKYAKLASEKPYYWTPVTAPDNNLFEYRTYYLTPVKNICRALCWRSKLKIIAGKPKSALEDIVAMIRIAEHISNKGCIIDRLVSHNLSRYALDAVCDILDRQPVNDNILHYFQQALLEKPPHDSYKIPFQYEKLSVMDSVQRFFTDDGKGDGHLIPQKFNKVFLSYPVNNRFSGWLTPKVPTKLKWFNKVWKKVKEFSGRIVDTVKIMSKSESRKLTIEKANKYYDAAIRASSITPIQLYKKGTDYDREIGKAVKIEDNIFIHAITPATGKIIEMSFKYKAHHSATITILALHQYKNDVGQYPSTLDKLIQTSYLGELPIDPFSDSPLVYKLTEKSFTLYSVGEDFDDDQGKEHSRSDGDRIFWPTLKAKKKSLDPPDWSTMPGMPGMGMPGMPGVRRLAIEQPPTDPNQIT